MAELTVSELIERLTDNIGEEHLRLEVNESFQNPETTFVTLWAVEDRGHGELSYESRAGLHIETDALEDYFGKWEGLFHKTGAAGEFPLGFVSALMEYMDEETNDAEEYRNYIRDVFFPAL
mgnify:CR=1 FL=1